MAGAFFFICAFVITVCGLLLFRPIQVNTITDYSEPAALEERKKVTVKMAQFLEKNPQIVKQKRFKQLPLESGSPLPSTPVAGLYTPTQSKVTITFQGSNLQFESVGEFDQWLFKNVSQDPMNFLKQFHENDSPEQYLDTLKKISEINQQDMVIDHIKEAYLDEARSLIRIKDGFHQQMMQKALQNYLDLEKDKTLGKKNADEVLKLQ